MSTTTRRPAPAWLFLPLLLLDVVTVAMALKAALALFA